MEDGQNSQNQTQESSQTSSPTQESGVSFPTVGEPKKNGGAKTLLIIGILILVGILGFVIYKNASKGSETTLTQPTPYDNLTTSEQNQATPVPTATPAAFDRSKIKVQIQNGTGISGEAAYLQTQLKGLGYTTVSVANSTQQNLTTTQVSFSSSLSQSAVDELTNKLDSIYQNVASTNSASSAYDVVIVTGLRKGATAKPSATPTVTPTAKPSTTPTASPVH